MDDIGSGVGIDEFVDQKNRQRTQRNKSNKNVQGVQMNCIYSCRYRTNAKQKQEGPGERGSKNKNKMQIPHSHGTEDSCRNKLGMRT